MLLFVNVTDFFQELLVVGVIRGWTPSQFEVPWSIVSRLKCSQLNPDQELRRILTHVHLEDFFHKTEFDCETLLAKKVK